MYNGKMLMINHQHDLDWSLILQSLTSWLQEPLVQSLILSPLIGALLGVLFSGANNAPSSATPVTVQQNVIIFQQSITVNHGKPDSTNDVPAFLGLCFIIIASVTWFYSRYSDDVLRYWVGSLFTCISFILSAGVVSFLRGQYTSHDWFWHIFTPLVGTAFSFYLITLAKNSIIPNLNEVAEQHKFIEFYLNVLKNEHRMWLLTQIIGVFFGIALTIISTFRSLHYLALMNQRVTSNFRYIWHFLARISLFSAHKGGIVMMILTSGFSYFLLSGRAYDLWITFSHY